MNMTTPEETAPPTRTRKRPARKAPPKSPARKRPAAKSAGKKDALQAAKLQKLLAGFSKRTTAEFGKAKAASRKAIQSSLSSWRKLETRRKVEFVAALLAALAATGGVVAGVRKKR
jgi:hypothetical protein